MSRHFFNDNEDENEDENEKLLQQRIEIALFKDDRLLCCVILSHTAQESDVYLDGVLFALSKR